jgi:hypothetical protein
MSDNAYFNGQTQLLFEKANKVLLNFGAATPASGKTASGSNGATIAAAAGVTTFTDGTALAFSPSMVGQTITITGGTGTHVVNNGVFLITGYTSASVITIANPLSIISTALSWAVLPSPTIVAGDINNAYLQVVRAGVGVTAVTTVDPFYEFVEVQADVNPATSRGNWVIQAGTPVQNITGVHPFIAGLAVTPNSWTIPIGAFLNASGTISATDLIPAATSGTNGAPVTPTGNAQYSTFVDSTAGTFSAQMVGSPIVITGGTGTTAPNNGTFTVLQFVNVNQIVISNPNAVTTTGLSWTVTEPAQMSVELILNNSGVFQGSPQ